jgi:hypothetical protein
MVVLATGPKVRGFRRGQGRRIFKGDKIRTTTSFGEEVKLSAHDARFYGTLKIPAEYD